MAPHPPAPDALALSAAQRQTYPAACAVLELLAQDFVARGSVHYLLQRVPGYLDDLAGYLEIVQNLARSLGKSLDELLEALGEYTNIYLRHQVKYMATGRYSQDSFAEVRARVYDDPELMGETYLPGLLLTQLFWPIHVHVLRAYRRCFLERYQGLHPAQLLDVGVGHGLSLLCALRQFPGARGLALDVSRHSLRFARTLLAANGVGAERCTFLEADITQPPALALPPAGMATMGEVLEHVERPDLALEHLRSLLLPGAPVFLTTVIDSNALDHIHQFRSQREIDQLIMDHGFTLVCTELVRPAELSVSDCKNNDPTVYYWAVAEVSGTARDSSYSEAGTLDR